MRCPLFRVRIKRISFGNNRSKTGGFKALRELQAYELLRQETIEDIHAEGYLLKHKKSGARVMILANDDENKVFNIAFRTPPTDSTGVAHILEHSVLCGSRDFPLKDPFVELVKGSLNTFLNAMTYPDKTMYPVASCNDQDFKNLMHVYLDAVFYPNIYKNRKIFEQEGWSYHLESVDGPLTYNGVVYNEMKGAFSSPEEVLDRTIFSTLFPDTPYGVESGGDPENIPDLTYEDFLAFHKKYYHPSNSYIYLYGNADMEERLTWLDEQYLSHFENTKVDSEIPYQKPFEKPVELILDYPVSESEGVEDNTYLSYNVVVGDTLDVELCVAFEVLEYALLSAPGAPLKQALLDEKIGKDIFGSYSDGILQPFFSIVAKNSDLAKKEQFLTIIRSTLEKLVQEGIDKKSLEAGINYFEFRFREADYSSYPKGLMYGIDVFDGWLYDDDKPFVHLQQLKIFASLKEKIGQGYFETLIRKYLLDNNHGAVVVIVPKTGLAKEREEALKQKLQAKKDSLSKEELEALVTGTQELKAYQEEEESQEALNCIPMLKRSDIKRETLQIHNEEKEIDGVKILHHEIETNGIGYMTMLFDMEHIPNQYIPYLGILKSVLGYVDTEHFTYPQLFNEINANTGGIICGIQVFNPKEEGGRYQAKFGIKSKALYPKTEFVFKMIHEILNTSNLEDEKRLYEIIAQMRSRSQMELVSAGHSTAVLRSTSYFSEIADFQEQIGGLAFYRVIADIEANWEERKGELIQILKSLCRQIFRPGHYMVSYVSNAEGYEKLAAVIPEFNKKLQMCEEVLEGTNEIRLEKKNEGIMTSGQVQYVAQSGNFREGGFVYTGALRILKLILSYDYLWTNIRVKGGAYGCMSGFKRCGDSYFVSYRDPNLKNTLDVFAGIPDYIRNFHADEHEMTKYIIGTVSGMDTPLNPSAQGALGLSAYMNGISQEDLQKERDQVLDADAEDIRALADLIACILKQDNICVVGSETAIEENEALFLHKESL